MLDCGQRTKSSRQKRNSRQIGPMTLTQAVACFLHPCAQVRAQNVVPGCDFIVKQLCSGINLLIVSMFHISRLHRTFVGLYFFILFYFILFFFTVLIFRCQPVSVCLSFSANFFLFFKSFPPWFFLFLWVSLSLCFKDKTCGSPISSSK